MPHGWSERRRANAALFKAIVDQFVARSLHRRADLDQFETLVCGLIRMLDADVVAESAADLCRHPETPQGVITELIEAGGAAARVAFELAPTLHTGLARVTAEQGPAELAAAIARRAALDRKLVAILASRGESEVLCALAANRRLHLDRAAQRALVQMGRDDSKLARLLLARDDLALDPEPLFLAADAAQRRTIVVEASVRALEATAPEPVGRAAPQIAAAIEACALTHDAAGLAEALAEGLDCRKTRARAILADRGGEALALALLALGVAEDMAIRIFLGAERETPDVERVRALVALMRSTPPRAAQRLVAAITGSLRQDKERGSAAGPARPQAPELIRRRKKGKRGQGSQISL